MVFDPVLGSVVGGGVRDEGYIDQVVGIERGGAVRLGCVGDPPGQGDGVRRGGAGRQGPRVDAKPAADQGTVCDSAVREGSDGADERVQFSSRGIGVGIGAGKGREQPGESVPRRR